MLFTSANHWRSCACGRALAARALPTKMLAVAAMLCILLPTPRAFAGELIVSKPIRLNPVVRRWVQQAGLIFRGTVVSVHPATLPPAGTPIGTSAGTPAQVEITFRVSYGIRGVRSAQMLTIREWAGPWLTHPHYRIGEQVFAMLYRPNSAGITSEIANSGSLRVDSRGFTQLPAGWLASQPATDPLDPPSDLPSRIGRTQRIDAAAFSRQIRKELRHVERQP